MPASRKPIYVTAGVVTLVAATALWAWRPHVDPSTIPVVPGHAGVLSVDHDVPDQVKPRRP
jgi:hypothetical protein